MPKEDLRRLIELLCDIDGTYYLGEDYSDAVEKVIDFAAKVLEDEYGEKW